MIKITLFALTITIFCISNVFADIAPNPIAAKGIITGQQTTVRMVSERIVIDLYKDSSVVECHFFMKNEGKKQQINIGFPEMNFYHFKTTSYTAFGSSFFVQENGKGIKLIDRYTPDSALQKGKKMDAGKVHPEYEKQPWYLWNSEFKEDETKIIDVRYSLPSGVIKNGCKYFTYLLNTGSGWKGSIDTAEVIVNLKDFSKELILKTMPGNCKITDNQIFWKFTNLEPTTNDDIKIYYEPSKGYSEKTKTERPSPTIVFNDETVPYWEPTTINEIAIITVLKDLKYTKKYTSGNEGVVLIYTKDFAIDKLKKLIASKHLNKYSLIYDSPADFIEKYDLVIDRTLCKDKELLMKILEFKEDEIKDIKIMAGPTGKTHILINKKDKLIIPAPNISNTTNSNEIRQTCESVIAGINDSLPKLKKVEKKLTYQQVPNTPVTIWYSDTNLPVKIECAVTDDSGDFKGDLIQFYFINGQFWYSDQIFARYLFDSNKLKYWMDENWNINEIPADIFKERESILKSDVEKFLFKNK